MSLMAARLTSAYNCAHFLCDAWEQETGESIRSLLDGFLAPRHLRKADSTLGHRMYRLTAPSDPCIVLWRRKGQAPHVGLYVRRAVLHLTDHGAMRQPLDLASIGYFPPRFYAPRPHHS